MAIRDSLRISSETQHLALVREFIRKSIQASHLKKEEYGKIVLAVDEAVTNIIRHGYDGLPQGIVELEIIVSPEQFEIILRDSGKKFSPSKIPRPNIAEHVAKGIKGGLGLFLIRQVMDEVHYCYKEGNNTNELRLVKYISGSEDP